MDKELKDILVNLNIQPEAHQEVLDAYDLINKKEIEDILKEYVDENVDYAGLLKKWQDKIEKKYNINQYLGDLLFCLLMSKNAEKIYKKKELSHDLFLETFRGISYTVHECKAVKKVWGTFVAWWFDDFYKLKRFKFGRLQFELTCFGHMYIDSVHHLTPELRCINIHIPFSGQPLSEELINDSMIKAFDFFRPMFNNGVILFKCESWLLYKKTLEFVNEESNIKKFSKRFIIFKQKEDENQKEMWRLFDDDINDLTRLKPNTSLRKKYLDFLLSGGKPGEGFGFFFA